MKDQKKRVLRIVAVVLMLIPIPRRAADGSRRGLYAVLWQAEKTYAPYSGGVCVGTRINLLFGAIQFASDTIVETEPDPVFSTEIAGNCSNCRFAEAEHLKFSILNSQFSIPKKGAVP